MLIKRPQDIATSEITQESVFHSRRKFVKSLGLAAGAPLLASSLRANVPNVDEELTPESIVTSYNNFYEFGMDKGDPARYAHALTTDPWSVLVTGEAAKTGRFAYEDVIKGLQQEERIYRFRCVEAWSMVVPWYGIPMKQLLEQFAPNGNAKYVEFTTLYRPSEMRGQGSVFTGIDWPYVEGLRMDEAYHPLTLMVTGVYGKSLPNQNGAPWRMIVPWKYGFKGAKSVVKIRFMRRQPKNTWNILAPREYGFYANVNPAVSHPRWSQASERRLPSTLFNPNRRPTLPFNGYAEQVASLYAGMDLTRHF
ncbi:MAG: protein-methionine-sulfoxide reductase catalytic subunit MsrP [Gammaproteobacteria bacterium]|nr:protein-methionine-sulfoxide reductase catalytic subunit MsrP [Gammaproteobacteria bacterium]